MAKCKLHDVLVTFDVIKCGTVKYKGKNCPCAILDCKDVTDLIDFRNRYDNVKVVMTRTEYAPEIKHHAVILT